MTQIVAPEWEMLTPELAQQLLDANKMNRRVRLDWVNHLAREMKDGLWKVNGDTIVIDTEGELANGQHRCHAVIAANYSFPVLIVRGIEPEARITIDDPWIRRFSDDLTMNGQGPNAVLKQVLLRRIILWNQDKGLAGGHSRISRTLMSQEYPKHQQAMENAIAMAFAHHRTPLGDSRAAFVAWLLLANAPVEVVDHFFSILAIGSQEERDIDVVRARDRILTIRQDPMAKGRQNSEQMIHIAIRAWNAWLTGKTAGTYALPRGRKLENPFPQPARLQRSGK